MIAIQVYNEAGLPDAEVEEAIVALNQFAKEVARAWKTASVKISTDDLGKYAWPCYLASSLAQEGALGYHDEEGNLVPTLYVGIRECHEYGVSWTSVLAHETAEAIVDPHINLAAADSRGRFWALETGDPVQGESYKIGNVEVSNFVKPNWFDPNATHNFDRLGNLVEPFQVAQGGYGQYFVEGRWHQVGLEQALPTKRDRNEQVR